jgi:hypothetical protein
MYFILFLLFLMCFIRHLPILLLKGKIFVYFNINKILGILLFTPCFLNIGANIYYFVGFFIQQNIYFIWDSTGFCLNPVPNIGLSPAGNTEDTLTNVFLEPNFRNDDNPPNEQEPNPRRNRRPRRNNHELAERREIRQLWRELRFIMRQQELIPAEPIQQNPIPAEPRFREPALETHPYFWQLARGYYWLPAGAPAYEFSIDSETIYNNNNGFLNRERLGGEPRLNRTSFGNALIHEYSVCLREDGLPVDGNPRYLEVYLTQACRQLDNSVYMTYFAPALREEIFWSLYGSLRLEYLLTHPLELEQPTLDEHMIVD